MMTSTYLCIILAVISAASIDYNAISAKATEVAFVKPQNDTACPNEPCLRLTDYSQKPEKYFLDNTTFTFLPGIHELSTQIYFDNVSYINFEAYSKEQPQVFISPTGKITWKDCKNVTVHNLCFVLKGDSPNLSSPALDFVSTNASLSILNVKLTKRENSIHLASSCVYIRDVNISGVEDFSGRALLANNSNVTFLGSNTFWNNSALERGGAATFLYCTCTFYGKIFFISNLALVSDDDSIYKGGGAIHSRGSCLIFKGSATFFGNAFKTQMCLKLCYVGRGGAIFAIQSNITFEEDGYRLLNFTKNSADDEGGAIFILTSTFKISNKPKHESDAEDRHNVRDKHSMVCRNKCVVFHSNTAKNGGTIFAYYSLVQLDKTIFQRNEAMHGGAINMFRSKLIFVGMNHFIQNVAKYRGGSISCTGDESNNIINMTGKQTFIGNSAQEGGALALEGCNIVLTDQVQVNFTENKASVSGGAVYYDDFTKYLRGCGPNQHQQDCFLEFNLMLNIKLDFVCNTAEQAGSVLYGGSLDSCKLNLETYNESDSIYDGYSTALDLFESISNITSCSNDTVLHISSDPRHMCICTESHIIDKCDNQKKNQINAVRGKPFTFGVVVLDEYYNPIATIITNCPSHEFTIKEYQQKKKIEGRCTTISYTISARSNTTTLVLLPDGYAPYDKLPQLKINITFMPCPDAFNISDKECICEDRLLKLNTECNLTDNSIKRQSNTFWIEALYDNGSYSGLVIYNAGCPFDYCKEILVFITLNNTDIQCNHNHSGILCGQRADGYSIALGTLHCLPCNNNTLGLIIPFGLAGIALVVLLLLLKVSLADGTLNGIIFYANVVQANRSLFFPHETTNILTVFIAWLNLDLGIETCFYNGMNAYIFIWLQFAFPFYVWFLIGIIIILSRHSKHAAKLLGTNPVSVLSTIVLLSYSKILRTIIAALSAVSLEYPNGQVKMVWLYDGSVPFFQQLDHILLGTFALIVLALLFMPYTFLLLFGNCFQAYSNWKVFSWINRIKPFMDVYHAPYKKHAHYWTGLLLLVRCVLYLVFALNTVNNAHINLVVITAVSAGLATLAWVQKLYEKWYNNLLEAASILNLCIFALVSYHYIVKVDPREVSKAKFAFTSVSTIFITFIFIILHYINLRLKQVFRLNCTTKKLLKKIMSIDIIMPAKDVKLENKEQGLQSLFPTSTVVELREPLLDEEI